MHPYLTRLGVRVEVQEFFGSYYRSDDFGDLVFDYGNDAEHFGFSFHKVPDTPSLWLAGNFNPHLVRQVFICSSAMEAISFLHFNYASFRQLNNLLFLSTGVKPNTGHLHWINQKLAGKPFSLIFGDDLLGKICDLKVASAVRNIPLSISFDNGRLVISFKFKSYCFNPDEFSLNAFEKRSGYRFRIKTHKPRNFHSYLARLKEEAFNP